MQSVYTREFSFTEDASEMKTNEDRTRRDILALMILIQVFL